MTTLATPSPVFETLCRRPSRASAAAIGQRYLLNGAPAPLKLRAIDALGQMLCGWSVAILEEAITEPLTHPRLRAYAVQKLSDLVRAAITRGYARLDLRRWYQLAAQAEWEVKVRCHGDLTAAASVEGLCNHLS